MIHGSQLNYILPLSWSQIKFLQKLTNVKRFLGLVPLFIGVEIILGIAIINKAGGAYGILSVITFHPINFCQWLYFLVATIILPFYISGLTNLSNKQKISRKILLTCLIYIADTICGFLYTVYFMYFWFSNEDTTGSDETIQSGAYDETSATLKNSPQSASQSREMFFIFSSTLIITAIRLYLTLVILSFTKLLLKQELNENYYRPDDGRIPFDDAPTGTSKLLAKIKFYLYKAEMKSKELLINFFK